MPLPQPLVTSSPETLAGILVFAGTRVPVKNLFDYLEGGDSLDYFLQQFPTVTREHAIAVLELARARRSTWSARHDQRAAARSSRRVPAT